MQIRAQLRIRRYADRPTAPEAIAGAHDRCSQQVASAIRFRPVLLKGEVEFQNQRPQRLRFGVLVGVDAITRPYEQAENQSQQQGDQADDRADHALRVADILNREQPLEEEAEQPAREGQQGHDQGFGDGIHAFASGSEDRNGAATIQRP